MIESLSYLLSSHFLFFFYFRFQFYYQSVDRHRSFPGPMQHPSAAARPLGTPTAALDGKNADASTADQTAKIRRLVWSLLPAHMRRNDGVGGRRNQRHSSRKQCILETIEQSKRMKAERLDAQVWEAVEQEEEARRGQQMMLLLTPPPPPPPAGTKLRLDNVGTSAATSPGTSAVLLTASSSHKERVLSLQRRSQRFRERTAAALASSQADNDDDAGNKDGALTLPPPRLMVDGPPMTDHPQSPVAAASAMHGGGRTSSLLDAPESSHRLPNDGGAKVSGLTPRGETRLSSTGRSYSPMAVDYAARRHYERATEFEERLAQEIVFSGGGDGGRFLEPASTAASRSGADNNASYIPQPTIGARLIPVQTAKELRRQTVEERHKEKVLAEKLLQSVSFRNMPGPDGRASRHGASSIQFFDEAMEVAETTSNTDSEGGGETENNHDGPRPSGQPTLRLSISSISSPAVTSPLRQTPLVHCPPTTTFVIPTDDIERRRDNQNKAVTSSPSAPRSLRQEQIEGELSKAILMSGSKHPFVSIPHHQDQPQRASQKNQAAQNEQRSNASSRLSSPQHSTRPASSSSASGGHHHHRIAGGFIDRWSFQAPPSATQASCLSSMMLVDDVAPKSSAVHPVRRKGGGASSPLSSHSPSASNPCSRPLSADVLAEKQSAKAVAAVHHSQRRAANACAMEPLVPVQTSAHLSLLSATADVGGVCGADGKQRIQRRSTVKVMNLAKNALGQYDRKEKAKGLRLVCAPFGRVDVHPCESAVGLTTAPAHFSDGDGGDDVTGVPPAIINGRPPSGNCSSKPVGYDDGAPAHLRPLSAGSSSLGETTFQHEPSGTPTRTRDKHNHNKADATRDGSPISMVAAVGLKGLATSTLSFVDKFGSPVNLETFRAPSELSVRTCILDATPQVAARDLVADALQRLVPVPLPIPPSFLDHSSTRKRSSSPGRHNATTDSSVPMPNRPESALSATTLPAAPHVRRRADALGGSAMVRRWMEFQTMRPESRVNAGLPTVVYGRPNTAPAVGVAQSNRSGLPQHGDSEPQPLRSAAMGTKRRDVQRVRTREIQSMFTRKPQQQRSNNNSQRGEPCRQCI